MLPLAVPPPPLEGPFGAQGNRRGTVLRHPSAENAGAIK